MLPTAVGEIGERGISRIPDSPELPDDTEETLEFNTPNSIESEPKFSSGSIYTQWGRSSCPDVNGTELVYSGRVAGSQYGTDYMCMPDDPEHRRCDRDGCETMNGVALFNHTSVNPCFALCAVCYTTRSSILMIPSKFTCPATWTYEYSGYLMTDRSNHSPHQCVDKALQCNEITGAEPQAILHPLYACNYCYRRPLKCVVCSR